MAWVAREYCRVAGGDTGWWRVARGITGWRGVVSGGTGWRGVALPLVVDAEAGKPGDHVALLEHLQTDDALALLFGQHILCRQNTTRVSVCDQLADAGALCTLRRECHPSQMVIG